MAMDIGGFLDSLLASNPSQSAPSYAPPAYSAPLSDAPPQGLLSDTSQASPQAPSTAWASSQPQVPSQTTPAPQTPPLAYMQPQVPTFQEFQQAKHTFAGSLTALTGGRTGVGSWIQNLLGGDPNMEAAQYNALLGQGQTAAMGGLTLQGYQQMAAARGGGAPTAYAGAVGAMPPVPGGTMPQNPGMPPPGQPQPGGLSAGGAWPGAARAFQASASGQPQPGQQPAPQGPPPSAPGMPQGGQGQTAYGNQPPPLFGVGSIMRQFQIAASTPGMERQAAALQEMLPKALPGSYLAVDGSLQTMPNANNVQFGQASAEAGGKAAGALPYVGPTASAEAWGKAPADAWTKWHSPTDVRPGNVVINPATGQPVYQAPVPFDSVDAQGRPTRAFITPAMGGNGAPGAVAAGPGGSGAPTLPSRVGNMSVGGGLRGSNGVNLLTAPVPGAGGAPGATAGPGATSGAPAAPGLNVPMVTGQSPLEKSSQEARGKALEEYSATLATNATTAQNQNFLIDQMQQESGNGAGWVPGRFSEWGGELKALFNGAGVSTAASDAALANYQAFQKNAMALTTQATRAVSPRAAVQEMQMIRQAMPQAETSAGGLNYIFNQLGANNDFQVAKNSAADTWRQGHGGTLDGFEGNWNQNVSPYAFLVHRMSEPDLQTMAGNLQKTPGGKALLTRMIGEVGYAQKNGLFQGAGSAQ